MKKLAYTIRGVLALLAFALTLIIVLPAYFIVFTFYPKEKSPFIAHRKISCPWAGSLFPAFGLKVSIHGKELLDLNQTYVFIANHRSLLDIPVYAIATRHVFRFLAKAELTKVPILGYVIRKLYISVDRKDQKARAKSMEAMLNSIREGISVFICPEGTRNTSNLPLLDFKDGAFRLAIAAQVPIAVLTLSNSGNILSPKHPLQLKPGTITGRWSAPIETKGLTLMDLQILKQRCTEAMLSNLV